jgi:hypothetical protein
MQSGSSYSLPALVLRPLLLPFLPRSRSLLPLVLPRLLRTILPMLPRTQPRLLKRSIYRAGFYLTIFLLMICSKVFLWFIYFSEITMNLVVGLDTEETSVLNAYSVFTVRQFAELGEGVVKDCFGKVFNF